MKISALKNNRTMRKTVAALGGVALALIILLLLLLSSDGGFGRRVRDQWQGKQYVLGAFELAIDNGFATGQYLQFTGAASLGSTAEVFNENIKVMQAEITNVSGADVEITSSVAIDDSVTMRGVHYYNYYFEIGAQDPAGSDYKAFVQQNSELVDQPLILRGDKLKDGVAYNFVWLFWADNESYLINEDGSFKRAVTTIMARENFAQWNWQEGNSENE